MAMGNESLTYEETQRALTGINAWRVDPDAEAICPRCSCLGLEVIDCSARPYTEWFALKCAACGLDQQLAIPLAPPSI